MRRHHTVQDRAKAVLRRLLGRLNRLGYRPERHYMRGGRPAKATSTAAR